MKNIKRLTSLALCLFMVLGLLSGIPLAISAAGTDGSAAGGIVGNTETDAIVDSYSSGNGAENPVLNIENGSITLAEEPAEGPVVSGYNADGDQFLNLPYSGVLTITGTTTSNTIVVSSGTHDIVLEDCNISAQPGCAFQIASGATVNLTLKGNNALISGTEHAGLEVPEGATLVINGPGSLYALGGTNAAGIGGGCGESGGTITINGGEVNALGGQYANRYGGGAGIGGGAGTSTRTSELLGSGGTITINGGKVTATGGDGSGSLGSGAGIGGGGGSTNTWAGTCGNVTINGGTVTAAAGGVSNAALAGFDIGRGGKNHTAQPKTGSITITGGNIKASTMLPMPKNAQGDSVSQMELTLSSCSTDSIVYRLFDAEGNQIAYGLDEVKTIGEKLYLWLDETTHVTQVVAGEYLYEGSIESGTAATYTMIEEYYVYSMEVSWEPMCYQANIGKDSTTYSWTSGGTITFVNRGNFDAEMYLTGSEGLSFTYAYEYPLKVAKGEERTVALSITGGNYEGDTIYIRFIRTGTAEAEKISDTCYVMTDMDQHVSIPLTADVRLSQSIQIAWNDKDNQFNTRPDTLTLKLNGSDTEITISDQDDWSAVVSNQPLRNADGEVIEYTWELTSPLSTYAAKMACDGVHTTLTLDLNCVVQIDENITNGTATADKEIANEGDTVTLTAAPNIGYILDSWTVTQADGTSVTVENNQFTMPASNVTVSATFKVCPHGQYEEGICTACGASCPGHTGGEATCTTLAVCDICGESYGEVDTTNHDETVACNSKGFCPNGCYEPATSNAEGYYEIDNAGKLFWFAQQVNSGNTAINGKLTVDIALENRAWTPIGNSSNWYIGIFDGNGKTISGLYFNDETAKYVGLFGCVDTNGQVKAVTLTDSTITGNDYVGGIVGLNNGTVTGCVNNAVVSGDSYVGGIVGRNSGTVELCGNTNKITADTYEVGGIVGRNTGTIRNCYNTGDVHAANRTAGGIAGYNSGTVEYCWSAGKVTAETRYEGGITGENYGTTQYCYATQYPIGRYASGGTDNNVGTYTTEQFASGEVAYLLSQGENSGIWGQTIGENGDAYPVLGGPKVYYGYTSCGDDAVFVYTNNPNASTEKPDHSTTADGDKAATCTTPAYCSVCQSNYGDLNPDNHAGEFVAEFEWSDPYENTCYAKAYLYCQGCEECVATNSGYGTLTGSAAGTDCLNPGSETYEITLELNGKEYSDSHTVVVPNDNHTGEWVDGFCSACGGYEMPTVDPGEDPDWDYDDTYLIYNAGQLYWFANHVNNVNNNITGKLMADIDLNPGYTFHADGTYTGGDAPRMWIPIGSGSPCYAGSFDGNGKVISGAYVVSEGRYVGIFGNTDYNYEIKNLGVTNSYIAGSGYAGGLIGYAYTTVSNCYVTDTVYVNGDSYTAGLIGYNGGAVSNCFALNGVLTDNGYYGSCTNSYFLGESENSSDGITAMTREQFASGEVAYLLQGDQEEQVWGQTIGKDPHPVFGDVKVYLVTDCKGNTLYSNTQGDGQHIYVDGSCTICGESQSKQFVIDRAQVELGNALNLYFLFPADSYADWTGCYAVITKTYADGRDDVTVTVPAAQWGDVSCSGVQYKRVGFYDISAKEMADAITIEVFNAQTEAISIQYSDSIVKYLDRMLDKKSDPVFLRLAVDMLNYGAAAQTQFKYNLDNLANKDLTDEQKAYGTTTDAVCVNNQVKGDNVRGASVSLENNIIMNVYFAGQTADMTAEVTFKNHAGTDMTVKLNSVNTSNGYCFQIDALAVADMRTMVTITCKDADGNVYGTLTDSVESYVARMGTTKAINQAIMKFSDSAKAYLD